MQNIVQCRALSEIEEQVCDITAEQLQIPRGEVGPESRLIDDLNCDSLEVVELMMALEDHFDVTIHDRDSNLICQSIFTRKECRLSVCTTWPATSGSGAGTGTTIDSIQARKLASRMPSIGRTPAYDPSVAEAGSDLPNCVAVLTVADERPTPAADASDSAASATCAPRIKTACKTRRMPEIRV
jgi:acyl carrier protein